MLNPFEILHKGRVRGGSQYGIREPGHCAGEFKNMLCVAEEVPSSCVNYDSKINSKISKRIGWKAACGWWPFVHNLPGFLTSGLHVYKRGIDQFISTARRDIGDGITVRWLPYRLPQRNGTAEDKGRRSVSRDGSGGGHFPVSGLYVHWPSGVQEDGDMYEDR